MAIPVLTWPVAAWRTGSENWRLEGRTIASPGLFGPGTVVHVENRVWRVTADLGALTPSQWREVRAVLDEARGQYAEIVVPIVQADPVNAEQTVTATFDAGITFDGGIVFAAENLNSVTVTANAPAGATRISLSSPVPAKAAMFSLPNDRVHRIAGKDARGWIINPPLREAVTAGAVADFATPTARMRLAEDGASLRRITPRLTEATQIELVEAL